MSINQHNKYLIIKIEKENTTDTTKYMRGKINSSPQKQ